jgi:ribosomal protein S18 acetylase RimI-like enzyme
VGVAYIIRRANPEDIAKLPSLERAAAKRFEGSPVEPGVLADATPTRIFEDAQRDGGLWVADVSGKVVGFALTSEIDGALHLEEVDVLPEHGRRGIGSALVRTVCDAAGDRGLEAVTLTTFRDVPWNRPWYAALGFRDMGDEELGPELRALVASEDAAGLRRDQRVVMRCDVEPAPPPDA